MLDHYEAAVLLLFFASWPTVLHYPTHHSAWSTLVLYSYGKKLGKFILGHNGGGNIMWHMVIGCPTSHKIDPP